MGRVRNSDVVAVRVVDVEAAAAVVVVGLPGPTVCRIGAVLKARRLDASEDGIERLLVDGQGVVVGVEALDSGEDQEWKDSSRSLRLALISSSQTGSGNDRLQHPLHPAGGNRITVVSSAPCLWRTRVRYLSLAALTKQCSRTHER
jgi:hypothetical protein